MADGDTFTLLDENNRQIRVRLHGIDCPEKKQDFFQVAGQFTSDRVFGKNVQVKVRDVDIFGRSLGIVVLSNRRTLNEELLKAGLAL